MIENKVDLEKLNAALAEPPRFSKVLAEYYHKWFRDSHDSAKYCKEKGDHERAAAYLKSADKYFDIIINNWDAIEFFSVDHNAFKVDRCLPEQWRGYR